MLKRTYENYAEKWTLGNEQELMTPEMQEEYEDLFAWDMTVPEYLKYMHAEKVLSNIGNI
jgi:hypothetical protein